MFVNVVSISRTKEFVAANDGSFKSDNPFFLSVLVACASSSSLFSLYTKKATYLLD